MLPLFQRLNVPTNRPILDVGCGKGGCAITLAQALSTPVSGIDIREQDIEVARQSAAEYGVSTEFNVLNVIEDPLPDARYGLLLMRDVVEHLPDIPTALTRLREMLDSDGMLYLTFPPWRGPYAGHQHNAKSMVKFMPYLHAVAPGLFLALLHKLEPERPDWLADERQICRNSLSRSKFERIVRETGWSIYYRQTYFLRPAFKRMGLPTIPNGFIGRLPIVGEMLSTACEYLLKPNNDK
jgi:ubiquinone/menaquinone biosynthesis C-methylase UbiE